jgi:hypothetical protein
MPGKIDAQELASRLQPKHLEVPEVQAIQETLIEDVPSASGPAKPDPKDNREYPFEFQYKDGKGKLWKGQFTNRVLSIRDRQTVGVIRARLGHNTPVAALDEMTQEMNLIIGHLSVSLIERPDWAKDLQALDDIALLQQLYLEVASHEAQFLGYAKNSSASEA